VQGQIAERWGEEEAEKYNPLQNCFTYGEWQRRGYQVRKGEKSLKSITVVKGKEDEKTGKSKSYPKTVSLFYYLQVDKIEEKGQKPC